MKFSLLLWFTFLTFIAFGQSDSVVAYYDDSIPKVRMFNDGHHESYYKSGEIMSWSTHNRDSCMRLHIPYSIEYYRSGNVKTNYFQLPNGFIALVGYRDEASAKVYVGRMHHDQSTFKFENNRLIEIVSERKKIRIEAPYMPSGDPSKPTPRHVSYVYEEDLIPRPNDRYRMKNTVRGKCIAKGTFDYFELKSGFIYYYNEEGDLQLTEKVVDGEIQFNPRVQFKQKELERLVIAYYDRNFNGYAEKREVDKMGWLRLDLPDSLLLKFDWSEVFLFSNLNELIVNERLYKMNAHATAKELKSAVLNSRGTLINTEGSILPPPSLPVNQDPEFVAFPDTLASFVGGEKMMQDWLNGQLTYPEESKKLGNQGIVYLEFFVMKNGSIEHVEVIRGVDPYIDRTAISLSEKMPPWKPARYEGKSVVTKVRIPIRFVLD